MTLRAGTRLGRYEIIGPLGAGGMGEVYRALDPRLERSVAVKVLPAAWAGNPERLGRFEVEARAAAALNHPYILAIYDIGSHEGTPYLVTELLDGRSLSERIHEGRLAPSEAVGIAIQIAQGLAAAHERGIVHRDLKPDNILIVRDDQAKILDFGLAKIRGALDKEAQTTAWETQAGALLGTFGYMAPEDVRGRGSDHRADLFAFGAVLFEMLTRERAFKADTSLAAIAAVLERQVPSPSSLNPEVPAALDAIVGRCLEKDPSRRFQSAREIVQALRAVSDERLSPKTERRAVLPTIAVLPFLDMSPLRDQDYFCEGVAEEITNTLAQARGLRVIARTSAFRFKGQARDVREIGKALGATAVLEGSIRTGRKRIRIAIQLVDTTGGHHLWSERFDRDMDDVLGIQDDISRRVAEALSARLAAEPTGRTEDPEAHTMYLRGRHAWNKRTEADLELSVDYFRRALDHDGAYAHAHAGLADALITLGIYGVRGPSEVVGPARSAALRALSLAPNLPGPLACLGCIEGLHDGRWDSAIRNFQRAIELNGDDSRLRQWYATNALVPLGRFDEALSELRLAQGLDPLSLPVSASIGIALYYGRRFEEAAEALDDSCRLESRFGLARMFLGYVYAALGRFDEAIREFETAMSVAGRSPENLSALGFTFAACGQADRAVSALNELLELSARRYVSPILTAQLLAGLGDVSSALDELQRARQVRALDLVWVRSRHTFDVLRNEARFQSLVR
jgi:TolB-like protein/tetratricopeptide (TPR) repeat protein